MAKQTQETSEKPKKRGRKPGTKSPRNIFCLCVGVIDAELQVEEVHVDGDKSSADEDLVAQATEKFTEEHGEEPEIVKGPYFQRKGQQTYQRKRDSIKIPVDEIVFTRDKSVAEYNGWEVGVRYIENHPDAAYIIFKRQLDDDEKKRAKPPAKTVNISALKNVRPLEEEASA